MNSEPRGLAVIINNHKFAHLRKRDGTGDDLKMLWDLFTVLSFKVEAHQDLTAEVSLLCIFCKTVTLFHTAACDDSYCSTSICVYSDDN